MNKFLCIATAAAALIAGGAQAQPYGYAGGELPAPAYAYAGYGAGPGYAGYSQAYDEGDCDSFTLLGAHAGVTVLGLNAGAGAHLGVGDDACRRHGSRVQFVPPPESQYAQPQYAPPPPPQYAPPQYAAPPPPCCMAAPQQYAPPPSPCCAAPPPPPPPCGCDMSYGYAGPAPYGDRPW